ncbi:MAG TPA: T9SS type A sorting domain-containing protein, partial [Chitinophagaceae bacterium]|nr:T9SS type A sorting domain-containing protein [Chitinophagaceae bacterium]
LDGNGQFLWAKKIGDTTGVNSIYIQDMKWLPNGHLSLIGDFNGTLDFDPGVNSVVLNSGSSYTRHGYIAEYDASGNFIDVKQLKGDWCSVFSMYTDSNNLHYVMYYYDDTLNLSFNTTTNQKIATGQYGNRGFAKFDANYNLLWNKDLDTNLFVRSIVPVNSSSFYVMSNFYGATTLNNGLNTSSVGFSDIAVDKWDQNGNVQWTKVVNGAGANEGLDLKMFDNHLYLLYISEDSTHFSTGIPSAIHSDNINMALSLFDNSFQHVSTATFDSDSSNYTFSSELLFDGSQALFKMYITGQTDVDPTPLNQLVSPAYGNNNPAVMVRLNAATLSSVPYVASLSQLKIYPNPTHNVLTVDAQESDYSVAVYNFLGQEVLTKIFKATNQTIDVQQLPIGLYTILLSSKERTSSATFEKN